MKLNNNIYRNRSLLLSVSLLLLVLLPTSCERRDLWVFQDGYKQVTLNIDWRNYHRDGEQNSQAVNPDGMTLWFYPADEQPAYTVTTSQVTSYETYLGAGDYRALVIDYSPKEYGKQEFVGMDYASSAKVQSLPAAYQPTNENFELYGPQCYARPLPRVEENGLYTVLYQPEPIGSDTLSMRIKTGAYNNYIPYEEHDDYQSTLVKQYFHMSPLLVPWRLRLRIPITGIYYLYDVSATMAGLADGVFLAKGVTSDVPCLLETFDVFGYLLRRDTFATTENAVLEAMAAGLPVVMPREPLGRYILGEDGGILIDAPEEYEAAMKAL